MKQISHTRGSQRALRRQRSQPAVEVSNGLPAISRTTSKPNMLCKKCVKLPWAVICKAQGARQATSPDLTVKPRTSLNRVLAIKAQRKPGLRRHQKAKERLIARRRVWYLTSKSGLTATSRAPRILVHKLHANPPFLGDLSLSR